MTTIDLRHQPDPDATQVLRQAGHLAADRLLTVERLRRALAAPREREWPRIDLQVDDAATTILRRADQLATDLGDEHMGLAHLKEANDEDLAQAAGASLDQMHFSRWHALHHYGPRPARRQDTIPLLPRQCHP